MNGERILSFVEARRTLSEVLDEVSVKRQAVIVAKRNKPIAVIVGIDHYNEMKNARKHLRGVGRKRILKLGGMAEPLADLDLAIRDLRALRLQRERSAHQK